MLVNKVIKQAKEIILGLMFKESRSNTRNSKIIDIIKDLRKYRIGPSGVDSVAIV